MHFSKSFGYALRGILYVALITDENRKVSTEEIADRLSVPRHFLAKIMKELVKVGILDSVKGPKGGFFINNQTFETSLLDVLFVTDGKDQFTTCVLHFRNCNEKYPCPLHKKVEQYRHSLVKSLSEITIGKLIAGKTSRILESLAAT
jgi:Rrf2 family protein